MQFTNPTTVPSSFTVDGGTIDTVTNPVDTDPTSTIANVTSSVPTLGRDLFFWPGISGESFPPSLSGVSYASKNGLPAYSLPNTATSVTFPNTPRVARPAAGPDKQGVRIKFRIWIPPGLLSNGAFAPIWQYGAAANGTNASGVAITATNNGVDSVLTFYTADSGGTVNGGVAVTNPTRSTWQDVEVEILSDGTANMYWNGVLVVTIPPTANKCWLPGNAATNGCNIVGRPASNVAGQTTYMTQLEVTYF